MKKIIIIEALFILIGITFSQWQPDVRLTLNAGNSYTSFNYTKCISINANFLHVCWYDDRDGNYEIYYKQSSNNGLNWGNDVRLTYDTAYSYYTSIASSSSNVYIVWRDKRDGYWEIYFKKSSDNGLNWSSDIRLTNNIAICNGPSIIVSATTLHVVWFDYRDGNYEIYYKNSYNEGSSWGSDLRLTNNPANSWYPSISLSGTIIGIVWFDNRDGNWEIYFKRSTDNGTNWGPDTRLTNNVADSRDPSITVYETNINVVWDEYRNGASEIYFKKSTDSGLNWGIDVRLTNDPANSFNPSTVMTGSDVHLVWSDNRDGNQEIYYKKSTDGGLSWTSDIRLTFAIANSQYPSMVLKDSALHIIWSDERDGNPEIYYKRNPNSNIVGIMNDFATPNTFSLHQNYPNPFNPTTKIRFEIPLLRGVDVPSTRDGRGVLVRLLIYDLLGREVTTLVNEPLSPGTYEVEFDGSSFASGVYFYTLIVSDASAPLSTRFIQTKKLILLK